MHVAERPQAAASQASFIVLRAALASLRRAAQWAVILIGIACIPTWSLGSPAIDDKAMSNEALGIDWPAYGRTFNQQRFSPLDLINVGNVRRLGLVSWFDVDAWNVSTVPLEANGVIYFAVGYSVVHAVGAVSGKLLWKYDPKVTGYKMRFAWGIRGLALWKDTVYVGTQDGRLLALAAGTARLAFFRDGSRGDWRRTGRTLCCRAI